jgi:hypothetical protein
MKLVALVSLIALLAAAAASAATPAQYRARVNAICRSYTPTGKILEADLARAQKANDYVAWGVALGKLLVLNLAQDSRIEAVTVPTKLKTTMAPILTRLRSIDRHTNAALADAQAGKSQALLTELTAIGTLAKPLNKLLDAAGLKDCGSNQP